MIRSYEKNTPKIDESCFIAESSDVIGKTAIGENSSVWYGAVIRGDVASITIGKRTNIQDNVTVHVATNQNTIIGDDVTVGHNAIVHGCSVGNRVLIGMGAIVLDGAVIEDDVIIGAGALIPPGKTIPSRSLVVGSPGKVIRMIDDEAVEGLIESANKYVQEAIKHKYNK